MSVGVAGSIQDALQIATTQLASGSDMTTAQTTTRFAVVLGTALKYDVAELVESHFSMVASCPGAHSRV